MSLARPTASLASADSLPSRTTGTPSNRPDSGTRTSMVSASTGLNRACSVASGSLSVRPTRSEVALKVSCTVPASKSTTRAPISTTEVSRAVPDHVDIDSLAIIGPAARAGRVQVHGQGNHHDVVGDHGRPHCDLQTRPHSRHRPGHALTRTTRGTSRARRRCAGRARARAARRRRRRGVGALAPRPPGRLTTGQGQQPHAGQDEPERNMRRRIVTGPFSCS